MNASFHELIEAIPQAAVIPTAVDESELDQTLVEQAAEYRLEQELIERAHPDPEQQILHRHDMCDGDCVRVFNGHNIDGINCH